MDRVVETHDIILEGRSSGSNHAMDPHVFSDFFDNSRSLKSQLSSRYENQNYGDKQAKEF